MLRTIEAIRLHAAAYKGELPAKLADVTVAAIPNDPVLGKPFEYTVSKGRFTLWAPPPAGESPANANSLKYEIKVGK